MHDEIIVGFKSSIHCIIQLYKSAVMALACFFVVVVNFFFLVCLCFFFLKLKLSKRREPVAYLTFQRLKEIAKAKSKLQLYFTTGLSSVYEVSNLL